MNSLSFELKTKSIPVELKGDSGPVLYTLREMIAADRDQYMDGLKLRIENSPDGTARTVKNFIGLQAELVGLCLYDAGDKKVPVATIQTWPASVVEALYKEAQSINNLAKGGAEVLKDAKNV